MKRGAWILVVMACSSAHKLDTDPGKLGALLDRYEIAIHQVAAAVATGTCADKAAALTPVVAAQRPVFEQLAELMHEPDASNAFGKLVDARGARISDPEIAFVQARHDCKDDAKFVAVIASMPR